MSTSLFNKATGYILYSCIMLIGLNASTHAQTYSLTDLGDLPGGIDFSRAFGVNDHGQVVGGSSATGNRAFLWDSVGGMQDLNGMLDFTGAGWILEEALSINSSGQIVGWRSDSPLVSQSRAALRPDVSSA